MAAAAAVAQGLLQGVFHGCIASFDSEVERRPYHRNCNCALHQKRGAPGARSACGAGAASVSFPLRRPQRAGAKLGASLPVAAAKCSDAEGRKERRDDLCVRSM